MTEGALLKLLRQSDLPRERFEEILRDRSARRSHVVRRLLAAHPRTPRREALSLVSTLFWRDLAHISADVRIHPEIRRAAERDLLRRLSKMALAERIDLARSAGRGVLASLRVDPDPRVVAALLDNRFTTEPDVVQTAARPEASPAALAAIAAHPRWTLYGPETCWTVVRRHGGRFSGRLSLSVEIDLGDFLVTEEDIEEAV